MKQQKLFTLLAQLSTSERRDLEKFLQSPLLNNRKIALDLYVLLQKKRTVPTKTAIFEALFPKEKYDDIKLRLAMSQLVKKIEAFWIFQYQQKQKTQRREILAEMYHQKGMYQASGKVLQKAIEQSNRQSERNGRYYFEQYELKLKRFDLATTSRTSEQNLQEVSDSLDTAFLILKLQQACSAVSHQTVYQQEYQLGLLPLVLSYIEENKLTKIPAVGRYYYCYLALTGQQAYQNFEQFKYLLFTYQHQFPKHEWNNLFLFGINICIRIINSGDMRYLQEILELYKKGLTTEALLDNDVLTRFTYQNITTAGIRTGDVKWTRQFLTDYKDKVEQTYRENAFRFNMARLAYHEQNYDEAIDLLRDTDQGDLLINLASKNLLLKIYYEMEEFKLLSAFLDAFQIYLRRKKVLASHRKNYWNMIYYTQKLMKVNPYDAADKLALKKRIEGEAVLLERDWLLGQLERI